MAIARAAGQTVASTGSISATVVMVTLAQNIVAGNTVVVAAQMNNGATSFTFSDNLGNTYQQDVFKHDTVGIESVAIGSCLNITTGGACTITVTANGSGGADRMGVVAEEYSGLGGAAVDKTASNTGSTTSFDSGTTATTTDPNELLFAVEGDSNNLIPVTYAGSFSKLAENATGRCGAADRIVSATGTYNATGTGSNPVAWAGAIATYKAAVAAAVSDGRDLSIPVRPTGPKRRRSFQQVYADTPATPVELTQSPAAPFRPGRGPGKGPMLLRRNLVWPSPTYSPDVTLALTGVQATGALGTLGVQIDVPLTGNAATGSVGTLTPGTSLALTGLSATGSVGTLAPSTDVAMTGVAGTGSVGTLAPSTTVTLTGNEATVTIGTLSPSGDVTVALTGVSASALIGDLTPSGGDVPAAPADTGSGGGSSLTFDEWLARHPWLRDYELRPNWYAYPPEKKKLRKQIVAAAKERKAVERRLSFAKDRSELDKLLEILNTLQERYNALQELYRAGLAAWQQSRAAEAEEEAEFMEHLINLL